MLLLNKQCWMLMMQLDPETGLDDEKTGGKVRASQGLDSVGMVGINEVDPLAIRL